MTKFSKKIDFVAIVSVRNANGNGDPMNANIPRTDYDGFGIISSVCSKRKIRNRAQDLIAEPGSIFVQADDRIDDGCRSLSKRAKVLDGIKDEEEFRKAACEKWFDVRAFGQTFAFKNASGLSIGIRGPVSIHQAISADPVEIVDMQIVKSTNGEETEGRASDRMGMTHYVKFGLYIVKGSINVTHAEKTGFSEEDAEVIKEALRTMFVNDSSSARPEGSMSVEKLYWFKHNCKDGQYSTKKVHESVQVKRKDGVVTPKCIEDYDITLNPLEGLEVEVLEGI